MPSSHRAPAVTFAQVAGSIDSQIHFSEVLFNIDFIAVDPATSRRMTTEGTVDPATSRKDDDGGNRGSCDFVQDGKVGWQGGRFYGNKSSI